MSRHEVVSPAPSGPPAAANRRRPTLVWMTVGCLLLLASGLARAYQNRQHQAEASITEACPFPLKTIPTVLGGWKVVEGGDRALDPDTMRITGGSDHIMRTYVDETTGVSLVALVLFGPAAPVTPHTPEVCFPASGYAPAGDMGDREIKLDGSSRALFRTAIYAKSTGLSMLREGVYYSFRLGGVWSPNVGGNRKFPRRNPGVFKIQVQRRVAPGERLGADDPIEQFLSLLLPAIEREIESSTGTAAPSKSKAGAEASAARHERGVMLRSASAQELGTRGVMGRGATVLAEGGHRHGLPGQGEPADRQDRQQDRRQIQRQGGAEYGIGRVAGHRERSSNSVASTVPAPRAFVLSHASVHDSA